MQSLRIGLALWADRDARELADLARAAEDAGFEDLWWPDHYYSREIGSVMALSAAATSRIRVGCAVASPLLRHPTILAALFATIDELSGGRAIVGLGPGGFELKTQLGVTTPSPLTVTRGAVEVVRDLLAGNRATFDEESPFPVSGAGLEFGPPGEVPIYLAARGPKMMELSGEVADGMITHGLAPEFQEFASERIRAGAARGDRSPGACRLSLFLEVAIDADRARAIDSLRGQCRFMVGGEYAEDLIPLYGLDPAAVLPVRAAMRANDPDVARLIDDRMVDAFAVAGPFGHVVQRLSEIAASGPDELILSPGEGTDAVTIQRLGEAISEVSA